MRIHVKMFVAFLGVDIDRRTKPTTCAKADECLAQKCLACEFGGVRV